MKILYFGNVCNYAYWFAKWSRELGLDAYALIECNDKVFSPEKEDIEYDLNNPPNWLYFYNPGTDLDVALYSYYDKSLKSKLIGYDLVHTFSYTTAIAVSHFNVPFIFHNVGSFSKTISWFNNQSIRSLLSVKYYPIRYKFRKALNKSLSIVASVEIDKFEVFNSIFKSKLVTIPIPYDGKEVLKYINKNKNDESGVINFLLPSRQNWFLKGQDLVFNAISKIDRELLKKCNFYIMEWGADIINSKNLIKKLGLENYFTWMPMLPRTDLWRLMSLEKSVVIVEFCRSWKIGGLGGVSRDALAVGVPVITYNPDPKEFRIHKISAPVFHSECDENSIQKQITNCILLTEKDFCQLKIESRNWIMSECDYSNVLKKYFELYNRLLG
jgi:glycosyltransferase involved in cell wall biosynthesis